MSDDHSKDSDDVTIATPCGTSYYSVKREEARRLFETGELNPSQYIWCVAKNQWVQSSEFFQNAISETGKALKVTGRLALEKIKATSKISMETIQKASQRHAVSERLRAKPKSETAPVPIEPEKPMSKMLKTTYEKVVNWLS